jgi:hypothetical protein
MWLLSDKRVRDSVMFLIGATGVIHELFVVDEPRAVVLIFLGSMLGIPFLLPGDPPPPPRSEDVK